MPIEPAVKRVVAFIDGQNLYHSAKEAFGYTYPNFDADALARRICAAQGWQVSQVRFYTGIPDPSDNADWHHFWVGKGAVMGRQGVYMFTRPLRYRNRVFTLPDGSTHSFLTGEEKGIDVRIALDIIRLAHSKQYDVALVFSQDQDLSEVAEEIRVISHEQGRWIKMACAYPSSPTFRNRRGINKTEWVPFDRATYDACLDSRDYRLKRPAQP